MFRSADPSDCGVLFRQLLEHLGAGGEPRVHRHAGGLPETLGDRAGRRATADHSRAEPRAAPASRPRPRPRRPRRQSTSFGGGDTGRAETEGTPGENVRSWDVMGARNVLGLSLLGTK